MDEMGFEDEAIRMAYELTVMKKQAMNWAYMNAILRRWHEQGMHTAAQIRAGDRAPRRTAASSAPPASPDRGAREDLERARRLLQPMTQEQGG